MTEADDDFFFAELLSSEPSDETWAGLLANALGSAPADADPALIPDELDDDRGETEPVGLDEGEELDDDPDDRNEDRDDDRDDDEERDGREGDEGDRDLSFDDHDVTDPTLHHPAEWIDPNPEAEATGLDDGWPGVDDHGAPW